MGSKTRSPPGQELGRLVKRPAAPKAPNERNQRHQLGLTMGAIFAVPKDDLDCQLRHLRCNNFLRSTNWSRLPSRPIQGRRYAEILLSHWQIEQLTARGCA